MCTGVKNYFKKAVNWFMTLSLKRKVVFLFAMVFLLVFSICFIGFRLVTNFNYQEELKNHALSRSLQVEESLKQYLKNLDFTAYTTMYSNWAQNILKADYNPNDKEQQIQLEGATHFLSNISQMNKDIGVAIYGNNGVFVMSGREKFDPYYRIEDESWINVLKRDSKYYQWQDTCSYLESPGQKNILSLYYTIRDYHTFEHIGYIIFYIPTDLWDFLEVESPYNDCILIKNENGNQVESNFTKNNLKALGGIFDKLDEFKPGETIAKNNDNQYCAVSYGKFAATGWKSYVFSFHSNKEKTIMEELGFWVLVIVPLGMLIFLIAVYFSKYLSKPIIQCKNAILEIRNNKFGVTIENPYQDEIGELISGFNDMSVAMESLISQNKTMEVLERESEFEMLQQKINPHFLYNTLEIINGLILENKSLQAVTVCETLGKMFRYNLGDDARICLRDEYEYIHQYLTIIYYKIPDLEFYEDIEEFVLDVPFYKFILQPLVENCIKHGFRDKREECCVTIQIKEKGGNVSVIVVDNGGGIKKEKLDQIEETFSLIRMGVKIKSGKHIGLHNVYQRLWMGYQEKFQFNIRSRAEFGTKMEIIVPKEEPKC